MQRLEVSGAVRSIYGSFGVKRLRILEVVVMSEVRLGCGDTGGDGNVRGVGCVKDTVGDNDVTGVGRAKETSSVRCCFLRMCECYCVDRELCVECRERTDVT